MVHGIQPGTAAAQTWHAQAIGSLAPVTWLFSGTQPYHMLGIDDATMSYGPAGHTFAQTLGQFVAGASPQHVVF